MKKSYLPPFEITPKILKLSSDIAQEIGLIVGAQEDLPAINLRKSNKIKTIQASLAIEGNSLTIEQITDLIQGKRVLAPKKDLIEVKNAIELYSKINNINPLNIKELLKAHATLMKDLVKEPGKFRTTGVGILKGNEIAHLAPPAKIVPELMQNLFEFLNAKNNISWLLKSCIFHYEFEYIHPFTDGNGRIGRLWQQLILMKEYSIFGFIPVEEIIKKNQNKYYDVLGKSDKDGNSTKFIEFSLQAILQALKEYRSISQQKPNDAQTRLEYAKSYLNNKWFSRKAYLAIHNISAATASRDLLFGLQNKLLTSSGSKNQIKYKFTKGQ